MFYDGSLQSGIGQAIQQQKLVACFIRDDGATSKQWEDEWLRSGWLSSLLEQKAILLRLESGSTEAGFLAAFCKIESAPTLVVIHNGKLQLQLGSETGQEEFVNVVRRVLGAAPIPGSAAAAAAAQASTAQAEDDLYGEDESAATVVQATSPVSSPALRQTQAPPAQRQTRAPPPPRAPAPAPAPPSNAKGKQRAADTAPQAGLASSPATTTSAQQEARAALAKKKREDAEELARIKARIEQDKAERKAQASARKAERAAAQTAEPLNKPTATPSPSTRGSQSPTVNLNVRLFDGRTVRSTFPRTATLDAHVRPWIDIQLATLSSSSSDSTPTPAPPYFFRHILAPQPSRELSAGDETQALGDVDLAPSATLVLVPVKGFSDAYAGSATNLLAGTRSGIVGGVFGVLGSAVGYAGSVLGGLLGTAPSSGQTNPGQTVGAASASAGASAGGSNEREDAGIRVRTLADQRARDQGTQQFYNGNQSNVEPRPDDRG